MGFDSKGGAIVRDDVKGGGASNLPLAMQRMAMQRVMQRGDGKGCEPARPPRARGCALRKRLVPRMKSNLIDRVMVNTELF